jgi:hydroxymethylbilane synthase
MNSYDIRIGTRGSPLALFQAHWVRDRLAEAHPHLTVTLITIKTTGDKIQDAPLAKIGGKGLFTKEIEEALIERRIDLAVHSIKDVPTEFPDGLHLAAITKREDPRDVFISKSGALLKNLVQGAKIGTSSLRRQAQLLYFRGDLEMVPLRGNLDTRIRKLKTTDLEGIVLALAGVKRLNLEGEITEILPAEISLPAIGQGALGIETRIGDPRMEGVLHFLNDPDSSIAVSAERSFLKRLGGGCQVPVAAFAQKRDDRLHLDGLVGRPDGKSLIRRQLEGSAEEAEGLGLRLAEILLENGAGEILDEVYHGSGPEVQRE